jgi:hypothetical protein
MPFLLSAGGVSPPSASNPSVAEWGFSSFTATYQAVVIIGAGTLSAAPIVQFWPDSADGSFVAVSAEGAAPDSTLGQVSYSWDGAGNLTLTGQANATADARFTILVFANL